MPLRVFCLVCVVVILLLVMLSGCATRQDDYWRDLSQTIRQKQNK